MQQKSSRVFPCSLGLPNRFMFGLQGVCCECVLRPRFENEPIFKLHLHTEKLVIVAQLSKHLHRARSLWPGSMVRNRQRAGGEGEQVWDGCTGGLCWRFCPLALMLSAGGASSFAFQGVWFLLSLRWDLRGIFSLCQPGDAGQP